MSRKHLSAQQVPPVRCGPKPTRTGAISIYCKLNLFTRFARFSRYFPDSLCIFCFLQSFYSFSVFSYISPSFLAFTQKRHLSVWIEAHTLRLCSEIRAEFAEFLQFCPTLLVVKGGVKSLFLPNSRKFAQHWPNLLRLPLLRHLSVTGSWPKAGSSLEHCFISCPRLLVQHSYNGFTAFSVYCVFIVFTRNRNFE